MSTTAGEIEPFPVEAGVWVIVLGELSVFTLFFTTFLYYRALSPDQGIQHMYMVHNAHMLAYSAMMVGREAEAMDAARAMWDNVPEGMLEGVAGFVDLWMTSVYDVQKRFGRWDDILAETPPPAYLPITTAIWRAHRAIAYAAKQDFDGGNLAQRVLL